jgi:hypothetical protein
MMDPENYIVCGDNVIAVPRSTNGASIQGRVLEVLGADVGRREFVLETKGTNFVVDGAVGVPESHFIFEVERGDSWVIVPPFLLREDAGAKAERSVVNTRKRIDKEAPLLSDQIEVGKPDVESMIARVAEHRREELARAHEQARRSTELRAQVASLINQNQFAVLQAARSRFPRSAFYGTYFWEKQLRQIRETGKPDIYVPQPPLNRRLDAEWLRVDREVSWLSPRGPRKVRVLYVGSSVVLVKLIGEPIKDYDPREFPYGNSWVNPSALQRLSD